MKAKSIIIFVVFFGLSFFKIASPISTQRITLEPEKFMSGTKVKVSFNFGSKSGTIQSVNIIGGVDERTFFRQLYKKIDTSKLKVPNFFWTAAKGKHKIWFQIKRSSLRKAERFERDVNVQDLLKPLKTKKNKSSFVLKPEHKKKISVIAKMIVRMESEKKIFDEISQYRKYISKTEGAGAQADKIGLEFMKRQVEKEIIESEREKEEKMLESQREHIEKIMEKIKEMMTIQSESIK